MPTTIKCPNCAHEFPLEEAVSEEYKKDLREQMVAYKKLKEEEIAKKDKEWQQQLQKKESDFAQQIKTEKEKIQQQLEESLRKTITSDFENKVLLLEQNNKDNEEKLKLSRQKELEFLQKEQALKNREEELEISVQRKLQEERTKIAEEIRKIEAQKNLAKDTEYQLKVSELEKQLNDQKILADEMRRKAEQGSTQLQGEVQELALEEMLRTTFPFDMITEVGKGAKGADCIHTIRNNYGQECGKIIYESKRTTAFANDWIEKLKTDMRSLGADVAVIVTKAMPKDLDSFGFKDGIWICSFSEVRGVVSLLRDSIMRVFAAAKSNENKGDKMHLLYNYLTSNEFAEQWKAMREGFMSMRLSIQKERDAMEKLWKSREKQLEKVLLNAAHIRGSIEGISGLDSVKLDLVDDEEAGLLE